MPELYRAKVVRVDSEGVFVEAVELGQGYEFGPVEVPDLPLSVGDRVVVSGIDGVNDDLVILTKLVGEPGAGTLEELADTNITSKQDGDFLTYDEDSGKWISGQVDVPGSLSDLGDVDTSGVVDSNVLTYNQGSGLWTPGFQEIKVPPLAGVSEPAFFVTSVIPAELQTLCDDIVGAANCHFVSIRRSSAGNYWYEIFVQIDSLPDNLLIVSGWVADGVPLDPETVRRIDGETELFSRVARNVIWASSLLDIFSETSVHVEATDNLYLTGDPISLAGDTTVDGKLEFVGISDTYTPTLTATTTNPVLGSAGISSGRWHIIGHMIDVYIRIRFGVDSVSNGSGNYIISLPFNWVGLTGSASLGVGDVIGYGVIRDNSAPSSGSRRVTIQAGGTNGTCRMVLGGDSTESVGATSPFTWAEQDAIAIHVRYPIQTPLAP